MTGPLGGLVDEVVLAFAPLVAAAQDESAMFGLLKTLGWTPASVPAPLADLAAAGEDLLNFVGADSGTDDSELLAAIGKLVDAVGAISSQPDSVFPTGVDVDAFKATIGRDLLEFLLVEHLLDNHHRIGGPLRLAGIIRLVDTPALGLRQRFLKRTIAWNEIGDFVSDPPKGFRDAFDWTTSDPNLPTAIGVLGSVLESNGLVFSYLQIEGALFTFANAGATAPSPEAIGIDLSLDPPSGAAVDFAAGVQLLVRPATATRAAAIALLPYADLSGAEKIALSDSLTLTIDAQVDFTKGVSATFSPGQPILLESGFLGGTPSSPASLSLGLALAPAAGQPDTVLIGSADGSHLSVSSVNFSVGAAPVTPTQLDAFVELDFVNANIVVAPDPGDADSFLSSFLPPGGLSARLSFGVRLSSVTGFHLSGSTSLQSAYPLNLQIGPITVQGISVAIKPAASSLAIEVGAAIAGSFGPVAVVFDRVGFGLTGTFVDPPSGNLGPLDVSADFLAPDGVGLSVDASGVLTGGGFIYHDPDESLYAGALQLSLHDEINLTAYGLVQTQLPGGQSGYSLIVVISTEFSPSIELPFGFTLDGVGGFIGINRTIDENAVEAALWAHHLDGLLFPANPAAAAPQLLTALDTYFPGAHGRYVFGPLAKIGWGGVVEGEVALLLELPEPIKLLLIGDIQALVPSVAPQLQLYISFAGGIDFGQKLAFFDASLHNSYITTYPISGDLAFRYEWGDGGTLALALGGFNPNFQPPPGFPTLKRLAITIGSSVAQIEAQAYLALTSNTLQFGAQVELTAGTGGFNVHGWLGFDALCERDPVSFEFDLSAGVDLRHGTDVLASVHLDGKLSGPSPWHISGDASISLLFFDISVHFDKTWGDSAPQVTAPDPLPVVLAALGDPSGWSGALGANARSVVTLLGNPTDAGGALLLDPAGSLRIAQRAIPLGQPVTRFAGVPLGHTVQLTIDDLTVLGAAVAAPTPTTEEFAPGQFLDLSDADQLSLPSFSPMDAGVEVGTGAVDLGSGTRTRAVATPFEYETTIIDTQAQRPGPDYAIAETALLAFNASAQGAATGLGRYAPAVGAAPLVSLAPERWVVAGTADLALDTNITADGTKLATKLALDSYIAANPFAAGQFQVVLAGETA